MNSLRISSSRKIGKLTLGPPLFHTRFANSGTENWMEGAKQNCQGIEAFFKLWIADIFIYDSQDFQTCVTIKRCCFEEDRFDLSDQFLVEVQNFIQFLVQIKILAAKGQLRFTVSVLCVSVVPIFRKNESFGQRNDNPKKWYTWKPMHCQTRTKGWLVISQQLTW